MNNLVRKDIRKIVDMLGELSKVCSHAEQSFINNARIALVQADYHDFHLNPKKKYVVPKSNFKYECEYF